MSKISGLNQGKKAGDSKGGSILAAKIGSQMIGKEYVAEPESQSN